MYIIVQRYFFCIFEPRLYKILILCAFSGRWLGSYISHELRLESLASPVVKWRKKHFLEIIFQKTHILSKLSNQNRSFIIYFEFTDFFFISVQPFSNIELIRYLSPVFQYASFETPHDYVIWIDFFYLTTG